MPFVDGLYYTVFEGGNLDQPPLVLLHGAGGSHLSWPVAIRRLREQRIYALDLPGHGRSEGTGLQSVAAYAQRVIQWMAALDLFQAVFVGHSMGGAIALTIAAEYPQQAAGLAVIASGAYLDVPATLLDFVSAPSTLPLAEKFLQERAFGPSTSPALVEQLAGSLSHSRPGVMAGDWRACAVYDLRDRIYRITAPVLVACGSHDRLTPLAFSHFLAGQLPQATLAIFHDAGHMVHLEQPDALAARLAQFLTDSRPPYLRVDEESLRASRRARLKRWEEE